MPKFLLIFIILIVWYFLSIFIAPDLTGNIIEKLWFGSWINEIKEKINEWVDYSKGKIIEWADYTKNKVDDARIYVSWSNDQINSIKKSYNDANNFLSGSSKKIDKIWKIINEIKSLNDSWATE